MVQTPQRDPGKLENIGYTVNPKHKNTLADDYEKYMSK
jgi:hypothetical protein